MISVAGFFLNFACILVYRIISNRFAT